MEVFVAVLILVSAVFILMKSLLKSKNGGCGCGRCGVKRKK